MSDDQESMTDTSFHKNIFSNLLVKNSEFGEKFHSKHSQIPVTVCIPQLSFFQLPLSVVSQVLVCLSLVSLSLAEPAYHSAPSPDL